MAGKREIINRIYQNEHTPLYKHSVAVIVDQVFKEIAEMAKGGELVTIRGFGTFRVKQFQQKGCRNPQTGEMLVIPARKKLVLEGT